MASSLPCLRDEGTDHVDHRVDDAHKALDETADTLWLGYLVDWRSQAL